MPSVEIAASGLFARDIAAYSDVELDQYLEENGRFVAVEDPENLPDDLIQRLRDRVHRASEMIQSRPVDLDQVAARLRSVSTDRERSSRWPSPATTASSLPEEEQRLEDLRVETECYNTLINDGGRPSHTLSRIEDIIKNPGEHREILSFWQGKFSREDEWRVFSTQLVRWHDFQRLQRYARGQSAYDYWRSEWEHTREMQSFFPARMQVILDTEDQWEREWQRTKNDYGDRRVVFVSGQYRPWEQFFKRNGHMTEQQGFLEYAEALRERLARHGFTRTFQLNEDAARQDKLTTWIEYLGYEYWWYDQHSDFAKRHQRRHDDAWKKLVDSNVLGSEETEDVLCNIDSIFQRSSEEERAEKAVQSAMSAVSSAEKAIIKSQRSRLPPQEPRQRLMAAQSTLEAAKKRHESVKRRNDLIGEFIQRTKGYRIAKGDAQHHSKLLRWILEQFPLIELDLYPPIMASNYSEHKNGGRKRKGHDDEDQCSQNQRRGEDGQALDTPGLHFSRRRKTQAQSRSN